MPFALISVAPVAFVQSLFVGLFGRPPGLPGQNMGGGVYTGSGPGQMQPQPGYGMGPGRPPLGANNGQGYPPSQMAGGQYDGTPPPVVAPPRGYAPYSNGPPGPATARHSPAPGPRPIVGDPIGLDATRRARESYLNALRGSGDPEKMERAYDEYLQKLGDSITKLGSIVRKFGPIILNQAQAKESLDTLNDFVGELGVKKGSALVPKSISDWNTWYNRLPQYLRQGAPTETQGASTARGFGPGV